MAKPQAEKSDSFPPVAATNHVKEALGINDLGGAMLRLTFLLCSGLFLVMLLGGRDFGQLRPGLAQAETDVKAVPVTAEVPVVETVKLDGTALPAPVVTVATVAEPAVAAPPVVPVAVRPIVAPAPAAPKDQVLQARSVPATTEPENTVFTLSDYADPEPEAIAQSAPEQAADGEVWYVSGNSLNVRAGPSTDDAVVGKLARGEAMLLMTREGDDWARIKIEGDGIEGYVATRFLSAEVPVIN